MHSIFLGLSLFYFFFYLYMLSHQPASKREPDSWPDVSVLVALRNEEKTILACCMALNTLDYPAHKLEILLLNDNSTDNSRRIIADYIKDKQQFQLIDITEDRDGLSGKINALAQALQQTDNEYIFVTDADCRPQPGWIKTLLSYYDTQTALISGFTLIHSETPGFFGRLQKTDMIYLQSMACMASNIHRPVTVIGNNITFKRSVYNMVGGFAGIGFSITEDHALMKAIMDKTDYTVRYIRDSNGPVLSQPFNSFKHFIAQRLRWMKGGVAARPFAFFLVGLSFIMHSAMLLFTLAAQWNINSATAIGLILGIDYILLKRSMKDLAIKTGILQFLLHQLFYIVYTHILIIVFPFARKIKWKDREYTP